MSWAGLSIFLGFVALAFDTGPVGWLLLALLSYFLFGNHTGEKHDS
jgi:hypothetical protein